MTQEPSFQVYQADLTDFQPLDRNPNRGTRRGGDLVRRSLERCGAGRSLVADKNGVLPAGNHVQEQAVDLGFEKVIVVETDGHALIVHKRTDWDVTEDDGPAREYVYLDNRAAQEGIDLDPAIIEEDLARGLELELWFTDEELAMYVGDVETIEMDNPGSSRDRQNLSKFDNPSTRRIRIECGEIMVAINMDLYNRLWNYVSRDEHESISAALSDVITKGLEACSV